jgi:hypothetical protein
MLKPEIMTQYTFRCDAPLGFGDLADNITESTAIAKDEATARRIVLDCYGHNYDRWIVLVSSKPILLYDPFPKYAQEIKTLRFAGPPRDDKHDN